MAAPSVDKDLIGSGPTQLGSESLLLCARTVLSWLSCIAIGCKRPHLCNRYCRPIVDTVLLTHYAEHASHLVYHRVKCLLQPLVAAHSPTTRTSDEPTCVSACSVISTTIANTASCSEKNWFVASHPSEPPPSGITGLQRTRRLCP